MSKSAAPSDAMPKSWKGHVFFTLLALMALAIAIMGSALTGFWTKPYSVELVFDKTSGQWLTGTFAEAQDRNGRVRLAIGVEDSYNSKVANDPTVLQIQFDDGDKGYTQSLVAKPEGVINGTLYAMDGRIYVMNSYSEEFLRLDAEGVAWEKIKGPDIFAAFCGANAETCKSVEQCDRVLSFNSAFLATRACAIDRGGIIWAAYRSPAFLGVPSTKIAPVRVSASAVVLSYFNDSDGAEGIIICVRNGAKPVEENDCSRIRYAFDTDFPYAIDEDDNSIIVFSSAGSVVRFDKNSKRHEFVRAAGAPLEGKETTSYQIYSALKFQKDVMLGGYPFNLVQKMVSDREISSFEPPLPVTFNYGEVQTLTLFKNRILAGVWPWGQVWSFDPLERKWTLFKRLFSHPDMTKLSAAQMIDEPYVSELKSNALGQRVNSFVSMNDSIYMLTSAKDGYANLAADKSALTPAQIAEYGAVHKFTATGVLAIPIAGGVADGDRIRVEIGKDTLQVFRNGKLIGRTAVSMKEEFCLEGGHAGAGQFGPVSGGTASIVKLGGALACG
jgi:hypothetical protein